MRKNHSRAWLCLAVLAIGIAYTVILMLIKPDFDISRWTLFAFTLMSLVLLIIQLAFGDGGIKAYPQFDYINTTVAVYYALFQFVVGGVLLMCFGGLPFVPVICVEAVVLTAYLVYTFILSAVTSHADSQDRASDAALTNQRKLISDLELMAAEQPEGEIKRRLISAAREIRFQDVLTPPELVALNKSVRRCVADLQTALVGDDGEAEALIDRLDALLSERKQKSRALKR